MKVRRSLSVAVRILWRTNIITNTINKRMNNRHHPLIIRYDIKLEFEEEHS